MPDFIRIRSNNGVVFGQLFLQEMEQAGIASKRVENMLPGAVEVIVTLGSAGVFTALYKVLSKLLNANKNRQITIQYKDSSISITGHSVPEEEALLRLVAPHLLEEKSKATEKKPGEKK